MLVFLNLFQQTQRLQVVHDGFSSFITVKTAIFTAQFIDTAIIIQNADHFQIMANAYFKVIGIVGRCHLYAAGTKLKTDVIICNNGNLPVH